MHAVAIPMRDATIVGLSSSPPDDVDVGCTVATDVGATVVGRVADPVDDENDDTLKGGSVPNTSVISPGTT